MNLPELDSLQARLNQLQQENSVLKKRVSENSPVQKIMIGVPILAWTHEFALSFLKFWTELMTYQEKDRRFHVAYNFKYRRPVHLAEEELAQDAVNAGCTHLLLMDDDIYDVTANDLFKLLDADKDVIGGIMHTGGFPHAMCAFRRFDLTKTLKDQPNLVESCRLYEVPQEQRTGVQMVDLIPFAFTLIKTSVFNEIPKPWFNCDSKAPTDSWFADSVLSKNLEYYAHFDVYLNHRGVRKDNVHLWAQLGMHNAGRENSRTIQLDPKDMQKHEAMIQERMKEAELKYEKEQIRRLQFYEKRRDESLAIPITNQEKVDAKL